MSIAAISFAATLPTYTSVGGNGTVFANDTLSASGGVLVNTNDPTTNTPSVLATDLTANGLDYTAQGFSISGNSLSVIYGLSTDATDAQNAQAADQATALSGGLPGNVTDFTSTGTSTGNSLTSTAYTAQTEGVGGSSSPGEGSAFASVNSAGGEGVSLASISADTTSNTIDVVFNLTPPTSSATPAAAFVQPPNTDRIPPPSGTPTIVNLLAGLPADGKNVTDALGLKSTTSDRNTTTASISPGSLLANILTPGLSQSASIYNLVASLAVPQPASAVNLVA
jgi:hypothetical protein